MHIIATYCSAVLLLLLSMQSHTQAIENQPTREPQRGEATFTVFAEGRPIGKQQVTLTSTDEGWRITSTGELGGFLSLSTSKFEVLYGPSWNPLSLTIDAKFRGQHLGLKTIISGNSAKSQIIQGQESEEKINTVSLDATILPNNFYGAYEALAFKLTESSVGEHLPIFIPPQGQIQMSVNKIIEERIQVVDRTIKTQHYSVTFRNPLGFLDAEIWSDEAGRLVRVKLPSLEIVRSDVASVAARRERVTRQNDENIRIPALGFSLAGTISKPQASSEKHLPAIVLVGGAAPLDRDETMNGIPIFGQLANALADAGFLVLRYDKRGLGQSGGRPEGAGLGDYASDVRAVVDYLEDREDVDDDRIVVLGHGEGGWVALQAASRTKEIAAVILANVPGTNGAALVLEQQRASLDRLSLTEEEKQNKINLQEKIHAAVVSQGSWEGIEPKLRQQAETPWFRSFLRFQPSKVIERVRQAILILHGTRDDKISPDHADQLSKFARARKRRVTVDIVRIQEMNHFLVTAKNDGGGENSEPVNIIINQEFTLSITDWLNDLWLRPGN